MNRAVRTKPIDQAELIAAIENLYQKAGLQPPRIVFASNPLIMVTSATFATTLSSFEKNSRVNSLAPKIDGTLNIYGATGTALDAVQCAIDDAIRAIKSDDGGLLHDQNFKLETTLAREIFKCTALAINLADGAESTNIATGAAETSLFDQLTQTLAGGSNKIADALTNAILDCRSLIRNRNTREFDHFKTKVLADVTGRAPSNQDLQEAFSKALDQCGPIVMHQNFCIASEFPIQCNVNSDGFLHGDGYPSQVWKDGWNLYHWNGTRVTKQFSESPESITVDDIEGESNLEMRRLMLERYGIKKYLVDVGAKEIQRDECGILYRHLIHEALDPVLMIEVTNSTIEADGTYKKYFLRVPPHITTAKHGVAWTFNLDDGEYAPLVQT